MASIDISWPPEGARFGAGTSFDVYWRATGIDGPVNVAVQRVASPESEYVVLPKIWRGGAELPPESGAHITLQPPWTAGSRGRIVLSANSPGGHVHAYLRFHVIDSIDPTITLNISNQDEGADGFPPGSILEVKWTANNIHGPVTLFVQQTETMYIASRGRRTLAAVEGDEKLPVDPSWIELAPGSPEPGARVPYNLVAMASIPNSNIYTQTCPFFIKASPSNPPAEPDPPIDPPAEPDPPPEP